MNAKPTEAAFPLVGTIGGIVALVLLYCRLVLFRDYHYVSGIYAALMPVVLFALSAGALFSIMPLIGRVQAAQLTRELMQLRRT